jgi:ABC-2 type transport system permease protein
MLRYAFRLHRWGMIGFGAAFAATALAQAAAFASLATDRAAFVRGMTALARQYFYILPDPHRIDTLAGYVLWRAWGTLPLLSAVWAVAAAVGAVRGDEEKRLVDAWLAAGVSRRRLVATRLAGFGLAALAAAAAAAVGTLLGAARSEPVPLDRAAGQMLALWLFMVAAFAIAFLVAQVPATVRAAQGAAAGVLLVLYMANVAGRADHRWDGLAWVSPFRWYDATNVLAPGGRLDPAAVGLTVLALLGAGVLAALAFGRRDVRGPLLALPGRARKAVEGRPSPLLRVPVARLLYRQRWLLLTWVVAAAGLAAFLVGTSRGAVDAMIALPGLRELLVPHGGDPYRSYIAIFWFSIAQLMLAGLAIHLVSAWAADDNEGVLAAELSRPRRRWAVVVERALAAAVELAIAAVAGSAGATLTARALGTTLDTGGVVQATLLLVPFGLTFAGAGAVASVWWPRASVGVLGLVAFASYMLDILAPLLKWPAWVADLSVFKLYGTPAASGVDATGLLAMLAIVLAGFALGAGLMERRELAR